MSLSILIVCISVLVSRTLSILEMAVSGRDVSAHCMPVPQEASVCRGVLHTEMGMPNYFNDSSVDELIRHNNQWAALIRSVGVCHPSAVKFLCSMLTPICVRTPSSKRRIIPPCRGFCEEVEKGCRARLLNFQASWLMQFNCDRFPTSVCFSPNDTNSSSFLNITGNKKCEFCGASVKRHSLVDQFCASSTVFEGNLIRNRSGWTVTVGTNLRKAVLKGSKVVRKFTKPRRDRSNRKNIGFTVSISGACKCREKNPVPEIYSANEMNSETFMIFASRNGTRLRANLVVSKTRLGKKHRQQLELIKQRGLALCSTPEAARTTPADGN